jgi:serine/threonine-protein kinase RsbW
MLTFIVVSYGQLNDCVEFELKVILNELIINAIKHGNNSDVSKKVKTSITISKSGFVFIIIEDEGEGYDYKCRVRNKDIAVNEDFCDLKETGRGIVIVSNLCDKIKFNKKGNKVIVMKRL